MALASLGFSGGPQVVFRINPSSIQEGFQIHTSVIHTVAGRVIQITGSTRTDLVVTGYLGENHRAGPSPDSLRDHAGTSWRLHEAFLAKCRAIMRHQSRDASRTGRMHEPAVFSFPDRNWRWRVYLKSVQDLDGDGGIEHRTGKYSHGYRLTMFVVQSGSDALIKAGTSNHAVDIAQEKAISSFIQRISEGIGWKQTPYNGGDPVDDTAKESDKGQQEDE
jgi:hypothetical protein